MMRLNCRRGDSRVWTMELTVDGARRNITNDFIRFTLKRSRDDLDSAAVLRLCSNTGGIVKLTQSGETKGQFTVSVTPVQTAALESGVLLEADVQFTFPGGEAFTPDGFDGTCYVKADVTRNTGSIASDT